MKDGHDGTAEGRLGIGNRLADDGHPAPPESGGGAGDWPKRRLQDHWIASLEHPDPRLANIGLSNCGLIEVGFKMRDAIRRRLAAGSDILGSPELQAAIGVWLKILRQVDRFTRIELENPGRRSGGAGNGAAPAPDPVRAMLQSLLMPNEAPPQE